MKLRFDESKTRYYAEKYLEDHPVYDNSVAGIVDEVKGRGYLTKSDLIVLSDWTKNARQKPRIKSNSADTVKRTTGFALSLDTAERDRIYILCKLDGVGPVVASAILHWFHDDHYPIWSPARYSVHLDKTGYTPEAWEAYVRFCRALAKNNKVCMRTLDRALWKYWDITQRVRNYSGP